MSKSKKRSSGLADVYSQMIQNASAKETTAKFKKLEECIRPDLLAKSIFSFSSSPEAFITIRSRCASSLGVLSVCLYILGIGDRHLENYLVDMSDGRIIGIDFGMAFGSGIDLPVPELMPIRFTRQFQNLFNPLDTVPLLKQIMSHALKALRENKLIILQVMQVFAKEPHLDWQSQAKKFELRTSSGDLPDMDSFGDLDSHHSHQFDVSHSAPAMQAWYMHKLTTAQKKLTGWNSAAIMDQELQYSAHVGKPYFSALQNLVQGDASSVRAKLPASGLSISDQLDSLIDHASDPNVLGRTWQGWAPFV
jgi:DNA-dependent protein kinase catalytic subunit